jgi:hypothetical protein
MRLADREDDILSLKEKKLLRNWQKKFFFEVIILFWQWKGYWKYKMLINLRRKPICNKQPKKFGTPNCGTHPKYITGIS